MIARRFYIVYNPGYIRWKLIQQYKIVIQGTCREAIHIDKNYKCFNLRPSYIFSPVDDL
jgi:hypothetical protein